MVNGGREIDIEHFMNLMQEVTELVKARGADERLSVSVLVSAAAYLIAKSEKSDELKEMAIHTIYAAQAAMGVAKVRAAGVQEEGTGN